MEQSEVRLLKFVLVRSDLFISIHGEKEQQTIQQLTPLDLRILKDLVFSILSVNHDHLLASDLAGLRG